MVNHDAVRSMSGGERGFRRVHSAELKNLGNAAGISLLEALHEVPEMVSSQVSHVADFDAGQVIFAEGDEARAVHVVLSGRVRLAHVTRDEREMTYAVLGPGDVFGELSLFDGRPRLGRALSLRKTTLACLPYRELRSSIETNARMAVPLVAILATRLRYTNNAHCRS